MSPAMTGALFGAALGFSSFVMLRFVAGKVEDGTSTATDPKRAAGVIRFVALAELLLFPVMGYIFGPMVLDA